MRIKNYSTLNRTFSSVKLKVRLSNYTYVVEYTSFVASIREVTVSEANECIDSLNTELVKAGGIALQYRHIEEQPYYLINFDVNNSIDNNTLYEFNAVLYYDSFSGAWYYRIFALQPPYSWPNLEFLDKGYIHNSSDVMKAITTSASVYMPKPVAPNT